MAETIVYWAFCYRYPSWPADHSWGIVVDDTLNGIRASREQITTGGAIATEIKRFQFAPPAQEGKANG